MWTLPINKNKPLLTLNLDGHPFTGIADTGADLTCVPPWAFPSYPVQPGPLIQGATGQQKAQQITTPITWEDQDGSSGTVQPLVIPNLPSILWGRDILQQSGATIITQPPTPNWGHCSSGSTTAHSSSMGL